MAHDSTWRVVSAAVQGSAHIRQGLPCQDALGYLALGNGAFLAALADGAGSAENSEAGARQAVEAALSAMAESLDQSASCADSGCEDLLRAAFMAARTQLEQTALEEEQPLNSYAATLTCVLVYNGGVAVGQLGDGAVVAGKESQGLVAVTEAQRGEYLNETYFLTQENALDRVVITVVDGPVDLVAGMSDGLTRLAFKMPGQTPHLPFFQPLFDFVKGAEDETEAVEQLAQFLSSERVCARTDDDKSLFLAVRLPVGQAAGEPVEKYEDLPEDKEAEPGI